MIQMTPSASWRGGKDEHSTVSRHLTRNTHSQMLALILLISWLHAWLSLPVEHMGAIGAAIPPSPRLPQQDHKLKNQLHVSKAEVDNLCITAKSHWFGESGVALSAARRLPWPGRYEPTLYCRAVNEVCGESGWQPVWCKYWKELVAE